VPKVLARGIAALTALAALAAAGPALGGDPVPVSYFAEFEYGGEISFDLVNENPKVRDIEIEDISAACEGEAAELDFIIFGKTPVLPDRSFAVFSKDPEGRGKAIVKGRFSRSFKRAEGSARMYGSYRLIGGEGWTKCESGKQKFVARISG
jgi:hypothetical protein